MKKRKEPRLPVYEKALSKRCMPAGSTHKYKTTQKQVVSGHQTEELVEVEVSILLNRKQRRESAMSYKEFRRAIAELTEQDLANMLNADLAQEEAEAEEAEEA